MEWDFWEKSGCRKSVESIVIFKFSEIIHNENTFLQKLQQMKKRAALE
jgi:hypothetical protein